MPIFISQWDESQQWSPSIAKLVIIGRLMGDYSWLGCEIERAKSPIRRLAEGVSAKPTYAREGSANEQPRSTSISRNRIELAYTGATVPQNIDFGASTICFSLMLSDR
jgi:hypothetical protein